MKISSYWLIDYYVARWVFYCSVLLSCSELYLMTFTVSGSRGVIVATVLLHISSHVLLEATWPVTMPTQCDFPFHLICKPLPLPSDIGGVVWCWSPILFLSFNLQYMLVYSCSTIVFHKPTARTGSHFTISPSLIICMEECELREVKRER